MHQVSHRRVKETSEGGGEDPLLNPEAPGKVKKRLRKRSTKKRSTGMVMLLGCVSAGVFVSLSVWIGSKLATALGGGTRRRSSNKLSSLAVKAANLMSLNPADYAGPAKASDEHETANFYRPQDAMEGVGDLSPRYAKLREEIDNLLPDDFERSRARVDELKTHTFGLMDMTTSYFHATYDIYNCPDDPPFGYPYQWKLTDILDHWPTDDAEPREKVFHGICVFDYNKDYDKAMRYRNAELPFITVNDPAVVRTVERWSIPGYVESMLGDRAYGCEYTENNHFMYGSNSKAKKRNRRGKRQAEEEKPEDKGNTFYAANKHLNMKYSEWVQHAEVPVEELAPDKPHWYFRLITCGKYRGDVCRKTGEVGSEYIMDELTFFQPKENLYLVDPVAQAGVHCRFGTRSLIAENHWDAGRNTIVVLKGMRRYILAHPKECRNLVLYPKGHPSARHSKMDWAHYDTETYPEFAEATANEVIMQPGHVLFLPATWFHYIISLDTNMQCNTRSGNPPDWSKWVKKCGF